MRLRVIVRNILSVGMNDYLAKPFDEPGLFQVISKNLTMSRPQIAPLNNLADSASSTDSASENAESASTGNGPAEIELAAGEKLYSLAMVEDISGGDQDFVKRMLQLFLDTMPGGIE